MEGPSIPVILLSVCVAVCILDITLPMMFRFGVEEGRLAMFLIIFLVCASAEETVQQALRTAVEDASAARRERIAVVGGDGESAAELVTHAAALNSERMVLVGPDALVCGG